jgi:hypothetical protein
MTGRPRIGEAAMTSTERSRRYRLRQRATKPATKPDATKCNEMPRNEIPPDTTKSDATKCNETRNESATKFDSGDSAIRIRQLEARIRELETALNIERGRCKVQQEGLENLKRELRAGRAPKPVKPPLPPDEIRDRKIKAQATQIQNLKMLQASTMARYMEALRDHGAMDFRTFSAISFVLHPDTRDQAEASHKDKALRGLNAWKADNSKAAERRAAS